MLFLNLDHYIISIFIIILLNRLQLLSEICNCALDPNKEDEEKIFNNIPQDIIKCPYVTLIPKYYYYIIEELI